MDTSAEKIATPLVSIRMLTYNRARYLKEAIESVLKQTYTNWELTIIDDGSTDDTDAIVRSFTDARIHFVLHEQNQGLLASRKESLKDIQGKYVAILDSDDVWSDAGKLEKQVTYMEAHASCAVVGTFITCIDTSGTPCGKTRYEVTDEKIRNKMLRQNQFAHSSVLMRTSMLGNTEGYRTVLAEDYDLFLQLGTRGSLANIPEYTTSYRIHGGTMSSNKIQMAKNILKIVRRYMGVYPHPFLGYTKAILRIIVTHLHAIVAKL